MPEHTLRDQLESLRQKLKADLEDVSLQRQQLEAAIVETNQEIKRLYEQLNELRENHESLKQVEADVLQEHGQHEHQAIIDALEASFAQLQMTQDFWVATARFPKRREEIQAAIPDLEQLLADYRGFDPNAAVMNELPKTFREVLLQKQQTIKNRLASYLELEAEEAGLFLEQAVSLQIVGLHDAARRCFVWVFPYRDEPELLQNTRNVLNDVVWEAANQIINLGQVADWIFDDVSVDSWEGYDALVVWGDYTGSAPIEEAVRDYLHSQLPKRPLFQRAAVDIEVAVVPYVVSANEPQMEVPAAPMPEAIPAIDIAEPELEASISGWYSAEDIKSWEAPLKVTEGSLWNVQARRLRTLLIRMVAHGYLGTTSGVLMQELYQGLPPVHANALTTGLQRLHEIGLFQEGERAGELPTVTLNGEHLLEIQNLINREISPFWAGIISSESN